MVEVFSSRYDNLSEVWDTWEPVEPRWLLILVASLPKCASWRLQTGTDRSGDVAVVLR